MTKLDLRVNGNVTTLEIEDPDMPLLYALRNECGLRGPRLGCGLGQCGACTVMLDGVAVRSCMLPVAAVGAQAVVTLEGLSASGTAHPVQDAIADRQATQCGYCLNGIVMAAAALLKQNPRPTEATVRDTLASNLCRCGSHSRVVAAIMSIVPQGAAQ